MLTLILSTIYYVNIISDVSEYCANVSSLTDVDSTISLGRLFHSFASRNAK